jgi:hypothetical protein
MHILSDPVRLPLPSLLGHGDKGIEIVCGKEKHFCTGLTRPAKAEQKSLLPARQA